MQEDFCFDNLSGCERVKLILEGILPDAFYLWRAKAHVETCILCQSSHPNVVALLFDQIRREESALIFEVEEIRGNHIREHSAIRILDCAPDEERMSAIGERQRAINDKCRHYRQQHT